jgi:hypothetical protein
MKFGGTLFSENHTCLMNFTKNLGWLTNQPWKPTVERIQPEKLPIEPKKFVDFQKYNTKIWNETTITSHKKDKIMLNINIHFSNFQSVVPFGKLKPIQPPKKILIKMVKNPMVSTVQGGAPQLCLLVYKPHEYYSYLRTINHSDIGVMFTNLYSYLGGTTLYIWYIFQYSVTIPMILPNIWYIYSRKSHGFNMFQL